MSDESSVSLPDSLLSSDDYLALSIEQQQSLTARLRHCLEMAHAGLKAANEQLSNLNAAIDDIELDALAIISAYSDPRKALTPYIVHSSWTFECDRQAMAAHVSADASDFISSSALPLNASSEDVKNWLGRWARVFQASLNRFSAASSFAEAVTQLIVIDTVHACYLPFAAAARLNANLPN